ncbi:hypothetical protein [Silanimonas algicola]
MKILRPPKKGSISKFVRGVEVVNILPSALLSLAALGFRQYNWEGFLAVDNVIPHERVVRAYGPHGCVFLGRRGKFRLYAWYGSKIARFSRLHSMIAGVEFKSKEFFMVGSRSIGDRFGLRTSIFGGFSVRNGKDLRLLQGLPLYKSLEHAPGQYSHKGRKASGMRWEGDLFLMKEANDLLHHLHERLEEMGIEHDIAYWTLDTGFIEAYAEGLGEEFLGPACDVQAEVPGHSGVSYTQGDGFVSAGVENDDPLWTFNEAMGR